MRTKKRVPKGAKRSSKDVLKAKKTAWKRLKTLPKIDTCKSRRISVYPGLPKRENMGFR